MDRFQELSKIALDELSEVFARMSDENVRELLEEIRPYFPAGCRKRRAFDERVCNAVNAFGEGVSLGMGRYNSINGQR
jgi:hypothetical protein